MSNQSRNHRWPDFFIVGAARAGTTSLYFGLKQHPDIFMPSIKETHFFSDIDVGAVKNRYLWAKVIREQGDYLKLFSGNGTKSVLGEACTSYLYDQHAPQRIKENAPEAKIVIVLREPIDRAYSHFLYNIGEGIQEQQPFYDVLVEDHANPNKLWEGSFLYLEAGLYYQQVKRYLDIFGSERVRIYLYDDMVADSMSLVEDICFFLGLPFYDGSFFEPDRKYNVSSAPNYTTSIRKNLRKLRFARPAIEAVLPPQLLHFLYKGFMLKRGEKPELDPRATKYLRPKFEEDILQLQGLIDRDLSGWLP